MPDVIAQIVVEATAEVVTGYEKLMMLRELAAKAHAAGELLSPSKVLQVIEEGRL